MMMGSRRGLLYPFSAIWGVWACAFSFVFCVGCLSVRPCVEAVQKKLLRNAVCRGTSEQE